MLPSRARGGRGLTEAGGADPPLLPAADHTEAGGVVRPWLHTGFGGRLGLGGPRGALGWGPTRLPGATGLGRGCCFGTEAPRSSRSRRAWGDSSRGSVSDGPHGLPAALSPWGPCPRSAAATGHVELAPGGLPSPRVHTQDPVQETENQCPEPPAPDWHTWASCMSRVWSLATSRVYKFTQAAGSRHPSFLTRDHHLKNFLEVESQDRQPL